MAEPFPAGDPATYPVTWAPLDEHGQEYEDGHADKKPRTDGGGDDDEQESPAHDALPPAVDNVAGPTPVSGKRSHHCRDCGLAGHARGSAKCARFSPEANAKRAAYRAVVKAASSAAPTSDELAARESAHAELLGLRKLPAKAAAMAMGVTSDVFRRLQQAVGIQRWPPADPDARMQASAVRIMGTPPPPPPTAVRPESMVPGAVTPAQRTTIKTQIAKLSQISAASRRLAAEAAAAAAAADGGALTTTPGSGGGAGGSTRTPAPLDGPVPASVRALIRPRGSGEHEDALKDLFGLLKALHDDGIIDMVQWQRHKVKLRALSAAELVDQHTELCGVIDALKWEGISDFFVGWLGAQ